METAEGSKTPKIKKRSAKALSYLEELLTSEGFVKDIKKIRTRHNIPEEGLSSEEISMDDKGEWLEALPFEDPSTELEDILEDIYRITMEYACYIQPWPDTILYFILFNCLPDRNKETVTDDGVCLLKDLGGEYGLFLKETLLITPMEQMLRLQQRLFPIAIVISPYAKFNDIKKFLKDRKNAITDLQKKYQRPSILLGKIRRKNTKERNDFIYINRGLSRKQLAKMVNEKFGTHLTYSEINTIIHQEKMRRSNKKYK